MFRSYKQAGGSTHPNLKSHSSNLISPNTALPEEKEQTAIAQVLLVADKEISLVKVKAEKLRDQKKRLNAGVVDR